MRISDWSSDVCSSDLAEIRKALAQMSVRPRPEIGAASATAATKAHDHAEHDHAEGEHEHTHGGIFGANTELIFAPICGGALATGFAIEKLTTAPAGIPLAGFQLGRGSCRARVCQYVEITVVVVSRTEYQHE